tara:strand:- start:87 stop:380 length:294 start_codon:yes stop_codon:yes gene_type:complete
MTNPTLIAGFEDIMKHIKNQEEQIKKLEEKNNIFQEHIGDYYQENQDLSAGMDKILSQFKKVQEENKKLKEENHKLKYGEGNIVGYTDSEDEDLTDK